MTVFSHILSFSTHSLCYFAAFFNKFKRVIKAMKLTKTDDSVANAVNMLMWCYSFFFFFMVFLLFFSSSFFIIVLSNTIFFCSSIFHENLNVVRVCTLYKISFYFNFLSFCNFHFTFRFFCVLFARWLFLLRLSFLFNDIFFALHFVYFLYYTYTICSHSFHMYALDKMSFMLQVDILNAFIRSLDS